MQEDVQEIVETEPEYTEEYREFNVQGKQRRAKVRIFSIDWEGKPAKVVVKRMWFGERSKFTDQFIRMEIQGTQTKTNFDLESMQINTLLYTLVEAPFPINEDYIRYELDGVIGEQIYKHADALNKVNTETKKN